MGPQELLNRVRIVPDFPKPGIQFFDLTTLFKDVDGFASLISHIELYLRQFDFEAIAAIDARGFIVGSALAGRMGKAFVPVRKAGKLPAATYQYSYDLEYGSDTLEIHQDALNPGEKIVIVDDLLATGGTALAACKLIEKAGGEIVALAFAMDLVNLAHLPTRKDLAAYEFCSILEVEG